MEFSSVLSFCSTSLFFSFVISSVRIYSLSGQAWAEGKGGLQRAAFARTADGKPGKNECRHSLHRLYTSMINQKKKHLSAAA